MASLTMSMQEVIKIFKSTLLTEWDKVKEVEIMNNNKIKAVIEVNKFFPQITAILAYNSFTDGILKFDVKFNNSSKLVTSFLKNLNINVYEEDVITIENDSLFINLKKLLSSTINWLEVVDVKMNKDSILFNLQVRNISN